MAEFISEILDIKKLTERTNMTNDNLDKETIFIFL